MKIRNVDNCIYSTVVMSNRGYWHCHDRECGTIPVRVRFNADIKVESWIT